MSPGAISTVVFACVFGGSLLGMFVRRLVPGKYLSAESKETVRLAMGLVATTLALVLGLLIASAKGFYDNQNAELTQLASNVVLLDHILAHYGPETADLRATLRDSVTREIAFLFAPNSSGHTQDQPPPPKGEVLLDKIQELSPKDDNQRSLRAQALTLSIQTGQTRWLIFEQRTVPHSEAVAGHSALLANYSVYQLRDICTFRPHDSGGLIPCGRGSFKCDFPYHPDVSPLYGLNSIV